jgi:hypothetical protein
MTKKIPDDLKGFEELLTTTDNATTPPINKQNEKNQKTTGLELLTFLEEESNRLEVLNNFFSYKIDQNARQSDKLLEHQIENNIKLKKEIIPRLLNENSGFMKSLEEVFNTHFKNIDNELDSK